MVEESIKNIEENDERIIEERKNKTSLSLWKEQLLIAKLSKKEN